MLAFPLSPAAFAELLPVVDVRFRLASNQELSGLGSGQILAAELAPSLWEADVTLAPLKHGESSEIQAKLEALDGAIRSFYLGDSFRQYPRADPGGSLLGSSTPVIASIHASTRGLALSGLPAGYVVSAGDLFSFDYGTPARRALHRICETVAADASGVTAEFEVRPHIRAGASAGLVVTLIRPTGLFGLRPGSVNPSMSSRVRRQLGFSVIQRL
ncbi:hypothetical protein [Jiella marina]|uniref:hypothetical protein n=1 Tax=Jiella sp. LLJ827 TaxID=2917712 RepID=UPI002101AA9B|nr:hypothetical protein [Jiella sp. LLJ827]MCQ0987550.1 hypothetical protein [Jiella sp. LLJ827]